MKNCVFASSLFLLAVAASGQDLDQLKTILPPSPNASSLGKYADWPVSLYTGIPSISVPLYEMKGRSISVPITLNYHASGIRVSEIASWVGLGFSLDAGGVITRSVNGLPDDDGGYLSERKIYTNPATLAPPTVEFPLITDSTYEYLCATGMADSEPDNYMFNALGVSYKVMFAGDGTIVTQPASNLKISCRFYNESTGHLDTDPGGSLMEWTVVLTDGTTLVFGTTTAYTEDVGNAQFGNPENGVTDAITAWYLNKIVSATGETITFTYITESNVPQSPSHSQSDYKPVIVGWPERNATSKTFTGLVNTKLLSKIESDLDSIKFTISARQDLSGGHALSEMKVYSKLTGQCARRFKYQYNYATAASSNTFYTDATYLKRLHLISLHETSPDSTLSKTWSFQYNSQSLPSRASFAQDHWGYYNGAVSNSTLLPMEFDFDPAVDPFGNREPDSLATMAEMLTQITYPTSGYSIFNYEANKPSILQDQYRDTVQSPSIASPTFTFTVNKNELVTLSNTATFQDYSDYATTVTLASINVTGTSGTPSYGFATIRKSDVDSYSNSASISYSFSLGPGTYKCSLMVVDPSIIVSIAPSLQYQKYEGTYSAPALVGGVRIKSIYDYDNQTSQIIKRHFIYESPFVIHPITSDDYETTTNTRLYSCLDEDGDPELRYTQYTYYTRYSNVKSSIGSIQGGTVGYGKVTTLYGMNGENGKTVSYFSNDAVADADLNITYAPFFPFVPVGDRSWRRGLLTEQRDYSSAGVLLKRKAETYSFVNPVTLTLFKASLTFVNTGSCQFFSTLPDIMVRSPFTLTTEQVKHLSSTEADYTKFADNSVDSVIVTKNFYYDTPGNTQATRTRMTDSQGRLITTVSRTAMEKTAINADTPLSGGASLAIDSLVKKNMVSHVIQQVDSLGGTLTGRVTTNYKIWYGSPSIVEPDTVIIQVAANTPEIRVKFNGYDTYGNLLEQQKTLDAKHAYIYDYKSVYPIAEVVNADAGSVAYSSFEADGQGNWSFSSSAIDPSNGFTGSKSFLLATSASVTKSGLSSSKKYKVTCWGKNGATVKINGTSPPAGPTRNGWTYYETVVSSVTSVTVSGTGDVDELRLYPSDAQMTTYTYDPVVGMRTATDVDNRTTYYDYDMLGRLTTVRDQQLRVLKTYHYHYKQ